MSKTGASPEAHGSFRFAIRVDNANQAIFTECTLPSLEVEIHEQKEGGYNGGIHLLPGRVKAGRITLKGGLTRSNDMLKWYQDVATGKPAAAKKQVEVIMYDSQSKPVMSLTFTQAYPVKWTGPTFKASENALAIESLELAYNEVTFN